MSASVKSLLASDRVKVTLTGPVTVPEPWRATMMVGAVVSVL